MKKKNTSIKNQLKNNAVALISLSVAIISLSYNTWRNEKTESNRNQRNAGFEIIVKINQLQQLVFHHFYDKDTEDKGNLRTGWALVLTIEDLMALLEYPVANSSQKLKNTWSNHWEKLAKQQGSVDAVLDSINAIRTETIKLLIELD